MNRRNNQRIVAAFDFDGTLTRSDSLLWFLRYSTNPFNFGLNALQILPILVGYALKIIGNQSAKEAVLEKFFAGKSKEAVNKLGLSFAQTTIPQFLRHEAVERLRWHQKQGHFCVVVSASLDVYLEPWGKAMGFDSIISSQLEYDNNQRVTGKIVGANCYGMEKVRRLRQLVGEPSVLYAYGDSSGDSEMLKIADYAYYRHMPNSGGYE